MNNKKIWYIIIDMKGLKEYTYVKTKAEADQLKKNINKIFNNKKIVTWIDFIWKNEKDILPESKLHGTLFKQTNTLIKDIGYYIENLSI